MRAPGLALVILGLVAGATLALAQEQAMTLSIISPQDWQVYQRNAQDQGLVQVVVQGAATGSAVQARLVLGDNPAWRGTSTDWVPLTAGDAAYTGDIQAAAGGWYRLEVEAVAPDGTAAEANVPRVGVGEVFIVAGQSNAANFGEPALKAEDERVATTDGAVWRHGDDPQQGTPGNGGGSPWPVLGDMLARSLQMPIAFLDVAQGGAHTWEWLPETNRYYPRLVTAGQRLGPGGARAVLWHQGESDVGGGSSMGTPLPPEAGATSEPEAVYGRMATFIRQLDTDLGWHLPWAVAQAAFAPLECYKDHPQDYPEALVNMARVRAGQALLWQRGLALQGPLTDDLTGPTYRCDQGGIWIHFNELGLRVHGQRWFALLWAQLYAQPPLHTTVVAPAG